MAAADSSDTEHSNSDRPDTDSSKPTDKLSDKPIPSRRDFLTKSGRSLLAIATFSTLPKELQDQLQTRNKAQINQYGLSILQGLTTETTTQLTVDVPKDLATHYILRDKATHKFMNTLAVRRDEKDFSPWAVDHVFFDGLELGHTYTFRVLDSKNNVLDDRTLKPLDLQKINPRISVVSCMHDLAIGKEKKWQSFFDAKPDLAFFIGDNVYVDFGFSASVSRETFWRRYIDTRSRLPFYHNHELVPCLALWDNHDYGHSKGGHDYLFKKEAFEAFQAFFAQDLSIPALTNSLPLTKGPGTSVCLQAYGHDFLFLDNRYFRREKVNNTESFFGAKQTAWMEKILYENKNPVWLMQGSQFFGAYSKTGDAFEKNYKSDFENFKNIVRKANRPTLLISGDIHYTEVIDLNKKHFGFQSYEITSSPLHTIPKIFNLNDNPNRIAFARHHNHVVVDIKNTRSGADYVATSISKNNKVNFKNIIRIG